jgi:hypothetical protein
VSVTASVEPRREVMDSWSGASNPARESMVQPISVSEWARAVLALDDPEGAPIVFTGADKTNRAVPLRRDPAEHIAAAFSGGTDIYVSTATYAHGSTQRTNDRARKSRSVFVDLDVEPDNPRKYADRHAALAALRAFVDRTGLCPTHLVDSGRGLHAWWALSQSIPAAQRVDLSRRLETLSASAGLLIDPAVMHDAARIMRVPDTVNSKNGKPTKAFQWRKEPYTLAELEQHLPVRAAVVAPFSAAAGSQKYDLSFNADAAITGPPKSVSKVIERCAAMAEVARVRGNVSEPYWRAMLGIIKYTVEGDAAAHELSVGHPNYDSAETDRKLARWSAGPATCAEFSNHTKACQTCPHNGRIKSPIVLGVVGAPSITEAQLTVDRTEGSATIPQWVTQMNTRYAVVRIGSSVAVWDERTPTHTVSGLKYYPGHLTIGAFKQLQRGRQASPGVALADAWLNHPARRQYEGTAFDPGCQVSPGVLNLWSGFGVAPAAGNVLPWLRALTALVKDRVTRRYVLRWLAWKVQNPGGVPGTILLMTGRKGSGKNSVMEPILDIFGPHGRLIDDAEQIAGRFNGHMQHVAFAVLDEALFAGDPKQADRMKSRVTARTMSFESKGLDAIQGTNRCAYVSLSNHAHVWQSTIDERRAVVVETGEALVGKATFWTGYHAWANGPGPAALLRYLQSVDVKGFSPRSIPKNEALRRQIEFTALRTDAAAAWWARVLAEGVVEARGAPSVYLSMDATTEVDKALLRASFRESRANLSDGDWHAAAKRLHGWCGPAGAKEHRKRVPSRAGERRCVVVLSPLADLRSAFEAATGVRVQTETDDAGGGGAEDLK